MNNNKTVGGSHSMMPRRLTQVSTVSTMMNSKALTTSTTTPVPRTMKDSSMMTRRLLPQLSRTTTTPPMIPSSHRFESSNSSMDEDSSSTSSSDDTSTTSSSSFQRRRRAKLQRFRQRRREAQASAHQSHLHNTTQQSQSYTSTTPRINTNEIDIGYWLLMKSSNIKSGNRKKMTRIKNGDNSDRCNDWCDDYEDDEQRSMSSLSGYDAEEFGSDVSDDRTNIHRLDDGCWFEADNDYDVEATAWHPLGLAIDTNKSPARKISDSW